MWKWKSCGWVLITDPCTRSAITAVIVKPADVLKSTLKFKRLDSHPLHPIMLFTTRRPSSCTCRATPSSSAPLPRPERNEPPSSSTGIPGLPTSTPSLEPLVKPTRTTSSSKPGAGSVQPLWVPKNRKQRLMQAGTASSSSKPQTPPSPASPSSTTQSQGSAPASLPTRTSTKPPPSQRRAPPPRIPISVSTDKSDDDGEYDEGEELGLSEEENERLVFGTVSNSWEAEVLSARGESHLKLVLTTSFL